VIAITDGSGAIAERYAYSAYGEPVFTNASGTVLADSAEDDRYTFTGREWDEELGLYHFRARMYDAESGRFCGRDPIGFEGSRWGLFAFVSSDPLNSIDPLGLQQGPIVPGQPWPPGTRPPSDSPKFVPATLEPPPSSTREECLAYAIPLAVAEPTPCGEAIIVIAWVVVIHCYPTGEIYQDPFIPVDPEDPDLRRRRRSKPKKRCFCFERGTKDNPDWTSFYKYGKCNTHTECNTFCVGAGYKYGRCTH
jgi:RHS repeat-associated protein